jgi:hypothetical protein
VSLSTKEHPYWHVRDLLSKYLNEIKSVEMSYYAYSPQTVVDARRIFSMPAADFFNSQLVEQRIKSCPHACEVAVHSKVVMCDGDFKHIPMIDMSTGSPAQLDKLRPILDKNFDDFAWFKSGRSYHGYGAELICHGEWVRLMGKLLLANKVGVPHTVDPRWVGHRLIAGYAALRWTKNTNHYIGMPTKLKNRQTLDFGFDGG